MKSNVDSPLESDFMSKPSSYRLAIVDLDDTLLGHDKEVSTANCEALRRLRAAGLEIVIASGRHHDNIVILEKKTGCEGWIISSAGAMVRHAVTGEILHEYTLPTELALDVYGLNRKAKDSLIGYHRTGVYIEEETEWTLLDQKLSGVPSHRGDLQALAKDGLQKLMWSTNPERIDALLPELERHFHDKLYVVHTEKHMIEFLSIQANKAQGARAVAEKLGIAREQVVAFGDGNNDVPLLKWAGMSVAMNHGRESARKAAKAITPAGPPDEAFARAVEIVLA